MIPTAKVNKSGYHLNDISMSPLLRLTKGWGRLLMSLMNYGHAHIFSVMSRGCPYPFVYFRDIIQCTGSNGIRHVLAVLGFLFWRISECCFLSDLGLHHWMVGMMMDVHWGTFLFFYSRTCQMFGCVYFFFCEWLELLIDMGGCIWGTLLLQTPTTTGPGLGYRGPCLYQHEGMVLFHGVPPDKVPSPWSMIGHGMVQGREAACLCHLFPGHPGRNLEWPHVFFIRSPLKPIIWILGGP